LLRANFGYRHVRIAEPPPRCSTRDGSANHIAAGLFGASSGQYLVLPAAASILISVLDALVLRRDGKRGTIVPGVGAVLSSSAVEPEVEVHRLTSFVASLTIAVGFGIAAISASVADPVAEFYNGKSIVLLIGFAPGGGYDSYARVLARHLRKHIPGQPNVIPQNMPGAGGLAVANFLYNVAPADGLTLGVFGPFNALEPLFGNPGARFDPTKFTWIGKMDIDAGACGAWRGSGIQRFSDLQNKEVVFGSSGRASTTTQQVLALKNMLGAKVKIVQGYKGSADITLAMRRGEVSAMCGIAVSNVLVQLKDDMKNGDIRIFLQFGRMNAPEFGNAENIYELLSTSEDRHVAEVIFRPNELGKPVASSPGIPEDRAKALRDAFMNTMKDPSLLAEMNRMNLPVNAATGEEVARIFASLYTTPRSLIDRALANMTTE
jgi:tripartite-type tricarboxylate transporter receptor subunit TctC